MFVRKFHLRDMIALLPHEFHGSCAHTHNTNTRSNQEKLSMDYESVHEFTKIS